MAYLGRPRGITKLFRDCRGWQVEAGRNSFGKQCWSVRLAPAFAGARSQLSRHINPTTVATPNGVTPVAALVLSAIYRIRFPRVNWRLAGGGGDVCLPKSQEKHGAENHRNPSPTPTLSLARILR